MDQSEVYVLRTIDYREHAKLVYMLSESGIISAVAHGAKKMHSPLRLLAQSGNHLAVTLSTSRLPAMKDASLINRYEGIKNDLIKTTVASVIHELIYYNITDDDDHNKLFQFLLKTMHALETTRVPLEILMIFELKFLYFLGYGLDLRRCAVCGREYPLYFDTHTALTYCTDHVVDVNRSLDQKAFKPLEALLWVDISQFEPLDLKDESIDTYMRIIDDLYAHYLSVKTKAKSILYRLRVEGE